MIISGKHDVNEAVDRDRVISPTANAKPIPDKLYDQLFDEADLYIIPTKDDFPMPWEADINVKGKDLVLSGHAGPQGYGRSQTVIPIKDADRYIRIEVSYTISDEVIDQLEKLGWKVK